MTDAELVQHIDRIAFEEGPSNENKLIRIQNVLYQEEQIRTAHSIRADEATFEETHLTQGLRR